MADASNAPAYSSNKAGLYLKPVCTLGAVALTLVIARVYTRLRRTARLHLEDWLIVAAEVRYNTVLCACMLNPDTGTFSSRHCNCYRSSCAWLG